MSAYSLSVSSYLVLMLSADWDSEWWHMLPSTCNHVTNHSLLSTYLRFRLNYHLWWAIPDCCRTKWCLPSLTYRPTALSSQHLCNYLFITHFLQCDVSGSGLCEHLTHEVHVFPFPSVPSVHLSSELGTKNTPKQYWLAWNYPKWRHMSWGQAFFP